MRNQWLWSISILWCVAVWAQPPEGVEIAEPAAGPLAPAERVAEEGAARAQVSFHSSEVEREELCPRLALEYRSETAPENREDAEALGDQRWRLTTVLNAENCRDHSLLSHMPAWAWEGAPWIGFQGPRTPSHRDQILLLLKLELDRLPLPREAVEKAVLRLRLRPGYPQTTLGKTDRAVVGLYRVLTAWPQPLCWDSHPEVEAEPVVTTSLTGENGWKDLDITHFVKKWQAGEWENHGFCAAVLSVERREPLALPDSLAARLATPENVLWNPGIEEMEPGKPPVGWRSWTSGVSVETQLAHSGTRSLKVEKSGSWRQLLRDIPPGSRVQLSAFVKTQGVDAETAAGACIQVFDANGEMDGRGFAGTDERFPLTGDMDWTRIECSTTVPEGTVAVAVLLYLVPQGGGGEGVGTVWFDDVALSLETPKGVAAPAQVDEAAEPLFRRAVEARVQLQWGEAERLFREFIEKHSQDRRIGEAYLHLGDIYANQGKMDQARAAFEKAIADHFARLDDNAQGCALYYLARCALEQKQWDEAEPLLNRVLMEYPGCNAVDLSHLFLGDYYQHERDWAQALEHYQDCIRTAQRLHRGAEWLAPVFGKIEALVAAHPELEEKVIVQRPPQQGTNLLQNSGFEEGEGDAPAGWGRGTASPERLRWDKTVAHTGQASVSMTFTPDVQQPAASWYQKLEAFPTHRKLTLSAFVKTQEVSEDGQVLICVRCDTEDQATVGFGTTQGAVNLTGTHDWTRLETEVVAPEETAAVWVFAFFSGTGQVWFDDVELTVGPPAESGPAFRRLKGPGIARAKGGYLFTATEDLDAAKIAFPLPPAFEDQAPIHFELIAKPEAAVKEWTLHERHPHHWVVELTFAPLKAGEQVELEWRCPVLIRDRDYRSLPREAPLPKAEDLPEEVRPWLAATACVQADDPQIVAKAQELRGESDNLIEIAERFTEFPRQVWEEEGPYASQLDAVTALTQRGSCTSNANLVAALFRASGVPARLLACYPTNGQPLQTHYIVEYFLPGYGWVWAESSVGQTPWKPYEEVVVNVVYPDDEDQSFGEPRWAAKGVPYLSLTELLSDDYEWLEVKNNVEPNSYSDHVAEPVVGFRGEEPAAWAEAFTLTQQVWAAYLATRTQGREVPEALAAQKAAAESQTLAEYTEKMKEAARWYTDDTTHESLPDSTRRNSLE